MLGTRGSKEPVRVLVVDDDPVSRRLLVAALGSPSLGTIEVREAPDLAGAPGIDAGCHAALISLDPGAAAEAVSALRKSGMSGPIVATSRLGSVAAAIEAVRAGADDFVVKPFQPAEVARRLVERIEEMQGSAATPAAEADSAAVGLEKFIGRSPAMRALYKQIARVAPSRAPVFITGESGTGKELCAEAIHARSGRAQAPFVAINCSAIPKELMESEIFGHRRGAFTGAHEDRAGAAEHAAGGTLFLDEICEMEHSLQAKLLRFVQTGTLRRVGDSRTRRVDLRFVCATNRDPAAEIAVGRFRSDLFYRLHVLPLHLPPLRERADDVVALARAFLARYAEEEGRSLRGFATDAEAALGTYSWPGNVRELQNAVRRAVVLNDAETVSAEMLGLPVAGRSSTNCETGALTEIASPSVDPFWLEEQRIIERALAAFDGNTHKAASALEISPSTIYRKRQFWSQGRISARAAN
jgi:two-component system repressor protein LuxO